MISPQEVIASDALDEIGQALKARGLSLEELIESGREIRGELAQEGWHRVAESGVGYNTGGAVPDNFEE